MTQPPYGSEDAFRSRLDAARLWSYGALGTWEALARAARRSGEEARPSACKAGPPPPS